jgi:hypothetical protein
MLSLRSNRDSGNRPSRAAAEIRSQRRRPAALALGWRSQCCIAADGPIRENCLRRMFVIDGVGVKRGPFAMVDMYGTPITGVPCTW